MKEKTRKNLKSIGGFLFAILFCATAFILLSLLVLAGDWPKIGRVNESQSGELYSPPPPENTAIVFLWEEGGGDIVYLDFENERIEIILLPQKVDENAALVYGYTQFEAVKANHLLLSGIIDRLGGIELEESTVSGTPLRYTGAQVVALIGSSPEDFELKRRITEKIFEKISSLGFSNKDFMFIINNSNTTISFPDCYGWSERLGNMSENIVIMN